MNFGLESSVLSLRCKYTSSVIGSRGKEKSSPGKNLDFMTSSGIESQPESAANGYTADRPDNDPENSISLKRSSKAVGQPFGRRKTRFVNRKGLAATTGGTMRYVGFAVAFFIVLASIANGQNTSGTYTTLYAGREFKTENYTVSAREDGNIKVEADTSMSGVHPQRISMILTSAYKPISYSQDANGAVLSAELSGSSARLRLAGQPDRTVSTDATAIFENVVWSPFIFLLRQYDTSKGGSQSFRAFSPTDGRTLSVRIERTNAPEAGAARQTADREYYVIVLAEKVEIDVWTDRDRTPLVFSIPSQSISVVRNGSEALADLVLKK